MTDTAPKTRYDALLLQLGVQAEALTHSEGWARWLRVARKFRRYSLQNQLLIWSQRPTATKVAGYRAWQDMGRQVRAGEQGIAILAPNLRKVAASDGEEASMIVTGFRVVFVFDVAQTEGDPLPSISDLPEPVVDDIGLLDRLTRAAERDGWPVILTDTPIAAEVRGWFSRSEKTIHLVEGFSPASQTRTLLHEMAHACDSLEGERDVCELVAESAAYLVGTSVLGIGMTDTSSLYVAAWGGDSERLMTLADRVLRVAAFLESVVSPGG